MVDAIVVLKDDDHNSKVTTTTTTTITDEEAPPLISAQLLPGGILITNRQSLCNYYCQNEEFFPERTTILHHHPKTDNNTPCLVEMTKRPIRVHTSKCPWLPPSHSVPNEERLLQSATISPSAFERSSSNNDGQWSSSSSSCCHLTEHSIQRAVHCLNEYGYCIIRGLLDPSDCRLWGRTVLESVHSAARVLLERDQVDIYHPHTSKFEPQAYREMSMREDLRLDLRHGPELSVLRAKEDNDDGQKGNEPVVVPGYMQSFHGFLRGNRNILEMLRRTMNPQKGDLYQGNLGRFNFGGSGADGSYQELRVSPVGGIATFAGCGDQSIHADTPHLFENIPDLPAHYINVFAAGTPFDEQVGGTAFVHGSHNLAFTAKHCGGDHPSGYQAVYPYLVRPCLDVGDVVLFDCRILHFGMSNTSKSSTERVLLYTNTTQAWFQDPKNWDDRRPIFESSS